MSVVMLVHGLALPIATTVHDGQYLVDYDPDRDLPLGHIVTTPNLEEAKRFSSAIEAMELWRRVSSKVARRPDGQPNRPLTAFTVEIVKVDE